MITQYLYPDHSAPAYFIRHENNLIPRGIYEAKPADYGLVAHRTADGTPPYTEWAEQPDGSFSRDLLGTEEERAEAALAAAKSGKYQERRAALLAARDAGFTYDGHRFESDAGSRELIQNALSGAMLAQSLGLTDVQFAANISGGWRNTSGAAVVTTIQGMINLFIALGAHMGACDAVSQLHKATIEACTTADECNALDVTTGYQA